MKSSHRLGLLAASLLLAHAAQAAGDQQLPASPDTGNTSAASNWRFAPGQVFGGVAGALDGVARLSFVTNAGAGYACSGSLLAGGAYVLTAAHCADDFKSMKVDFGWYGGTAQLGTRTVATTDAWVHPGWNGDLDTGADIAILKLSAPVTNVAGYKFSTTNDVGKKHLIAGYGTTQLATTNADTNWNDGSYGHYGWNTFDVLSKDFNLTVFADDPTYGDANYYRFGATYMVDFDRANSTAATNANYNVLQRAATTYGGNWTSDAGWGVDEALIAGGDSGGGDFVWSGSEWILSGVHSWGWNNPCPDMGLSNCNAFANNPSSYGDLSGSTATFSHADWINSIVYPTAVPEPESYALMLAGLGLLGALARRRRA